MTDLSIIIVNYNVRQFLENALTSVQRALEGLSGEVFVVDNASDDGSAAMVRASFPTVRLIESGENLGFARANNLALREARGRLVLLLNPDTVVQEETFRVMLRFFDTHPDAGLAGCKILNPDGSFQLPCRRSYPTPWVAFTKTFGLSALFPRSRWFGRYNLTYLDEDATYPVDAVSGSFMMVRRDVVDQVGGLDERFFMYGEDLDWCFRVTRTGYRVYYTADTAIIHFKGESTRRSDLDELRVFYQAMLLFVEKHFHRSVTVRAVLYAGIALRASFAWLARVTPPFLAAATDAAVVALAMVLGELLYFGELHRFPPRAYPAIWLVPAGLVVTMLAGLGLYTVKRDAVVRAAGGIILGFVIVAALVFFLKEYAFSRAVVVLAGSIAFLLVPGWRILARTLGRGARSVFSPYGLFGRRTVIVGTGPGGQEVARKLLSSAGHGYTIVGYIDRNRARIGERVGGIEILGSLETAGKVLEEHRVGEVIFSTDGISYTDILTVIARTRSRGVNFRLVPGSLEAIIGKTRVDPLETIPLVEIEYNVHRPGHRFGKRMFDVLCALALLALLGPWLLLRRTFRHSEPPQGWGRIALFLPRILRGELSFVGQPLDLPGPAAMPTPWGPRGLTGLVQLQRQTNQSADGEQMMLYYAKNQSLLLDLEILLKAVLSHPSTSRRGNGENDPGF